MTTSREDLHHDALEFDAFYNLVEREGEAVDTHELRWMWNSCVEQMTASRPSMRRALVQIASHQSMTARFGHCANEIAIANAVLWSAKLLRAHVRFNANVSGETLPGGRTRKGFRGYHALEIEGSHSDHRMRIVCWNNGRVECWIWDTRKPPRTFWQRTRLSVRAIEQWHVQALADGGDVLAVEDHLQSNSCWLRQIGEILPPFVVVKIARQP